MLILLLCARDLSAFILSSPPSEITETVTSGNIFRGMKTCSEGHA
jgi:hypothetical protein